MRPFRLATALLFLGVFAGCGGGDKTTKPIVPSDGLPAGTPKADSPTHLMQRFEVTWESKVEAQYALLLSDDFRFHFSPAADPSLTNLYGDNWKRADEVGAITHLFHGFTSSSDVVIPGANRIDLSLTGNSEMNDPDHPDSTSHYRKWVVTSFLADIEVPSAYGPVVYDINSRQEFYLVRGDAAVVPAGSPADSTHWYMRRWDDLSPAFPAARKGPVINPATPATLGKVKSTYR